MAATERPVKMLSAGLLSVALLVNVFYREGYRVLICFVAILVTVAHTAFFNDSTSFEYYGTVSISCLIMILAISLFSSSPLGTDIQIISLLGIFVNMIGYYLYQAGISHTLYNDLMTILITIEFIRLMIRTDRDRIHGMLECGGRANDFYLHDNSSNNVNFGRHK